MKYGIAKFKRYIPQIEGMRVIVSFDNYSILEITNEAFENFPSDIRFVEVSEFAATQCWKFYGEVRGYRSAYSDAEGLEPDPESLAKGKRKTKVYFTQEIYEGVKELMSTIMKANVADVFDARENRDGEQAILDDIDSYTTIRELCYGKEKYLGIEMSKTQLLELGLWDNEIDSRIGKMHYILGF
jgi:hypothetical protein